MEEKQIHCKRCHDGILRRTVNPNEIKYTYCGYTKIEMSLADFVAYKGYVGP